MSIYDASTIATLRRALDEVVSGHRFSECRSGSTLEVAEHLLKQASTGERDLNRLKESAFQKFLQGS
jgi:hypothetical protein